VLTAMGAFAWVGMALDDGAEWPLPLLGCSLLGLLFVLGCVFNYYMAIIGLAVRGKMRFEAGMETSPLWAFYQSARCLLCFLAGPALIACAAVAYWVYNGDPGLIDWLILAELGVACVGWWLIALLLNVVDDRFLVASPRRVLTTALSMKRGLVEVLLLSCAAVVGQVIALGFAVSQLYVRPFWALILLCTVWTAGLYLGAFVFRRLGVTYYRSRRDLSDDMTTPAGGDFASA
jgi:hypothetical protein